MVIVVQNFPNRIPKVRRYMKYINYSQCLGKLLINVYRHRSFLKQIRD